MGVKHKNPRISPARKAQLLGYSDSARGYCEKVVLGDIRACQWVKMACERHLSDLARSLGDDFEYRFDPLLAGKRCAMLEKFPHVKGHWALHQETIRLEPWQAFIGCSIFGWVHKKTGLRRFRQAIILVPRKNAKTTLAAGIGNIMFAADGEPGAEVYCGASNEKQAQEVFSPASRMAKRANGFKDWFGITVAKKSMYILDDGSKFETVIGVPGDGPSPHCFIHDEFHEQPTWFQYDAAKTGMGARRQPLQLIISTAGIDIESPCHELQEDLKKILKGDYVNERIFGIIYTVDDPEKWNTIEAAQEANPNYGVSVLEDYIASELAEATQRATRQNAYKCKNLNIWVNAREAWMNMEKWKGCADPSLRLSDFRHDPCYQGFDLGARIDLTSRMRVFVRWEYGVRHYYLFGRHYVPLDRANDGEHPHYSNWIAMSDSRPEEEKFLIGHAGPEIQLAFVQKEIESELENFNFIRFGFDQHQAMQMQQELKLRLGQDENGNDKVLDVPQTWKYLDPAMKELEAAVFAGRVHHTGDPVLRWAIGNVLVRPDANENVFPRKEPNRISKIDPASALLNAMYLAISSVEGIQYQSYTGF